MDCRGFLMSYGQGPLNSWVLPSCWYYRGLWEFDEVLYGGILLCVFNVRMRKAPASYEKQFFAMSKSLSVEAPYLNVLYQPIGCPQRAESNQTVKDLQVFSSKPSFKHAWKYSNHRTVICAAWQNTTLDSACHCFCSSAKHGLSFQTPCAYYKGFKLNLPHNSKTWAMLCSPHLCDGMDRRHQSMLFFSTGTTDVKHKACTPLALCLPCCRDSWWSLEGHNSFAAHTNTWIMPIFCRKNRRLIKNGKMIHLQSKVKLSPGYWSSR